ncbi:RNA polymerase sigma factor, sigma-70 family [Nocardiopsis flavescens]|uniref:RNA polymerase sigma factor, sigma-70 family n=2 Tax=Nocardiopsis flavescens TaxID=758803 RepID=A0A1M6M070_9ACTN|nr:sigma-70 family RNA polymerase sigma factor [Nocardiopsis flavescens]SHJ76808.1 RNA polymerase sigma factor, sigma-70 family [Nocardiopsis flavescens]
MSDAEADHTEVLTGDAEYIRRVRDGETAAYAVLYERHAACARGLARQLLRGDAEVEDAVAEAFTRVLSVIQRGKGPTDSFRPYLLTAVRNAAYDRGRGEKRQVVTDDMDSLDPGVPFVDPALEGLERSLIARAFLSLPERWQAVLWHTEIEGAKPSEAAAILGLNPNGVAALAYRAREGLRQAYLQMHLAGGAVAEACRPTVGLLGGYVRGGLSKRDTAKVDKHLDGCADCREVYAELMDVNVGLRGVILPMVVGVGATGYLALTPGGAVTGAWWNRMSRRQQQATAGGVAAAGVAVAVALALVGGQTPVPPANEAAPAQVPPAVPPAPGADPDSPQGAPPLPGAPPARDPEAGPPDPDPQNRPRPDDPAPAVPPADVPEEEVPAEEAPEPLFAVGIDPVGALVPGGSGIMVLDVRNLGAPTLVEVLAMITLPPGVEMAASGGAGNAVRMADGEGDWSCAAGSGGGECARPAMGAGENSTYFFDVTVSPDAELDVPATATVSSGAVSAAATGERGVTAEGVPARYATAGRVAVETVGNSLMTCTEPEGTWPWPWWGRPGVPGAPGASPGTEPSPAPPAVPGSPEPEEDADLSRAPRDPDPVVPGPGPDGILPGTPVSPEEEGGAEPSEPEGAPPVPEAGPDDDAVTEPGGATPRGYDPEPSPEPGPLSDGPCAQARERQGDARDNDNWVMAPRDDDANEGTASSSSAVWNLPEGGRVRWAGLYFSAAGSHGAHTARIKGPAEDVYHTVTATDVRSAELPGFPAYQAFADVTGLVRAQGGGQWWVGDIPALEGRALYAGWSLVVVVEDPAIGSYNQAMVLDETGAVFHDSTGLRFPVSGLLPASVAAQVDVVAWEGDADLGGDRVTVDGAVAAPVAGYGTADNVFVGSARGAVGDPMAFGTDVVRFAPVLGRETDIRILSEQDAVLAGVVALVAPMRT